MCWWVFALILNSFRSIQRKGKPQIKRVISHSAASNMLACGFVLLAGIMTLLAAGCRKVGSDANSAGGSGPPKLKVAYLGLTCEAPIFSAYEKGFFEEEGLEVELVKTDWDGLREGLGTG